MKRFILFFLLLLISLWVFADTHVAASCSRADVLTAYNAASNGDIVSIPAGTCTWTQNLDCNKAVHFKGASEATTILLLDDDSWVGVYRTIFRFTANTGVGEYNPKFSDMTLKSDGVSSNNNTGLRIQYGARDFMVWNMTFEDFTDHGMFVEGYQGDHHTLPGWDNRGVIFDCTFTDCYKVGLGYGVHVYGDGEDSWTAGLDLGSQDAVFIEDCTFTGCRHSIASGRGGRYVFRYNTASSNTNDSEHVVDAHGWVGVDRGTRQYEIYENTINGDDPVSSPGIKIRGGDGVIFNNTIQNLDGAYPLYLHQDNQAACVVEGYPCKDQIRELHIWGNTVEGSAMDSDDVTVFPSMVTFIVEDRDWFMDTERPAYTPFTYPHPLRSGGNGNGNGNGTSGKMPATTVQWTLAGSVISQTDNDHFEWIAGQPHVSMDVTETGIGFGGPF